MVKQYARVMAKLKLICYYVIKQCAREKTKVKLTYYYVIKQCAKVKTKLKWTHYYVVKQCARVKTKLIWTRYYVVKQYARVIARVMVSATSQRRDAFAKDSGWKILSRHHSASKKLTVVNILPFFVALGVWFEVLCFLYIHFIQHLT